MFARPRLGRRSRVVVALAAVVLVGSVACSAVSSLKPLAAAAPTAAPSGAPAAAKPAAVPAAAKPAAVPAAALPASAGGAAVSVAAQAPAAGASDQSTAEAAVPDTSAQLLGRMVIRTAQLTMEVPDVEQALLQVREVASRGGGFVSGSNTHYERVNDQDRMVADLTLQVRSDAVDSAMNDLRGLGKVTQETSGSQDVTEEYVDLDANLRNLQASETAILKLMDRATQIQDVISLQRELTNVRGQIERIQGRKTYLERRTDMATISISLRLPAPASAEPLAGGWNPLAVAQRGWQASLAVLRGVAETVIIVVAFSWWLLPFLGVGAYLLWRRRHPAAQPAAPAPAA